MKLLKHDENIYEIPGLLSAAECAALVDLAESKGFKEADVQTGAGRQLLTHIRNNDRVDCHSPERASLYWERMADLALPTHEGMHAVGLSPYFRFYKYCPGQKFNMHKDGRQRVGNDETRFTLLIYLNEGCVGGETLFRQSGLEFSPRTGSAIIFEHHLWHKGAEVINGCKYVLRSDIAYR